MNSSSTAESAGRDRQADLAETFARLHRRGDPLLLPNAWDVGSAVMVAGAGAKVVATTSAGVAWSLGVPDGADLGAERAAAVVGRIAAALDSRGARPQDSAAALRAGDGRPRAH
jgi:2-methylisocitrate lyase-like PEP mutase family enzyme